MLKNIIIVAAIGILAFYIFPSTKNELPTSDKPFKTKNANRVWVKAKEVLKDDSLKRLYKELKTKDQELIQWKKDNRDKEVKDTAIKEKLLAEIKSIKEKYNLTDDGVKKATQEPLRFKDSRLQEIWSQVSKSPYYHSYELDRMMEEMDDLQNKIDKVKRETADDNQDGKSQSKPYKKVNKELKQLHDQVQEDIKVLDQKHKATANMMQNSQILELWNFALDKKYGLTGEECENIKEDLRHMYAKVLKQSRFLARARSFRKFDVEAREMGYEDDMMDPEMQDIVRGQQKVIQKWYLSIYRRITGENPPGINPDLL
ncbi:Alpha-2-macroglobulin receptor-associated protein [Trichoplax sp. H2]|nr:Alpha-2-macroglobulin receptor-associated protein [Trichoplax sp. H2]|eukprot:RDD38574.1 Alpha-2-macroglobulin receptor-associated protein [Trichoplax sp. H2]